MKQANIQQPNGQTSVKQRNKQKRKNKHANIGRKMKQANIQQLNGLKSGKQNRQGHKNLTGKHRAKNETGKPTTT